MNDVRETAESVLEEYPDLEPNLRSLLERDRKGPWSFEDIPLDSGEFGEIVSRGLVEETDAGYELADAAALERALAGEETSQTAAVDRDRPSPITRFTAWWRQNRLHVGLLVITLGLTAFLRTAYGYGTVFRDDHVVLAENDPYLTAYWVEYLHSGPYQSTNPGTWSGLPAGLWDHDLLTMVLLWVASDLLGGSSAVGPVLAVYPVIAGVLLGLILYGLTTRLTADYRIGLAAVFFYAVTPAIAQRTSIGFADTEGFDYLWLALTVLAIIHLTTRTDDESIVPHGWTDRLAVVLFGLAVTAQLLSWRGGPLLIFPFALFFVCLVLSTARADLDLFQPAGPFLLGLAIAGVLTLAVHLLFGWLQPYRAVAPLLLLAGAGVTVLYFTVAERRDVALPTATAGFFGLALVGGGFLWRFVPPVSSGILEFIDYMQTYTWGTISETQSIFSPDHGSILGPVFHLGLGFLFGFAALCVVTWLVYARHRPAWLAIVVYGWYFFLLSIIQLRFAGHFGLFIAIFAGAGVIHFLAAVDLARPIDWGRRTSRGNPVVRLTALPSRRHVGYVFVILFIIGTLGALQLVSFQAEMTHGDERYDSAAFVDEYSDDRGQSHPESYVFSEWGVNRMYNDVVNEHAHSYHYARHNYAAFIESTDPESWYETLAERTGYVVTADREGYPTETVQTRLHDHFGSATDETPAVSNYRAIYASSDGSIRVFALVPGATVRGLGPPGELITASTSVTLPPASTDSTYETQVEIDDDGAFEFTTPYPGTYEVGNQSVTVSEDAVENGTAVEVDE